MQRGSFFKIIFPLLFSLFISNSKIVHSTEFNLYSSVNFSKYFLVNGCQIYDLNGSLMRNYNGSLCAFFEDGTMFMTGPERVRLNFYDKKMKILNFIDNVFLHHQINKSLNGNLLLLGSDIGIYKGKRVRFDRFIITSSTGKLISSYSFKDKPNEIIDEHCDGSSKPLNEEKIETFEFSHFNSFYEIPPQVKINKNIFFKEGNYILNSASCRNVFIFDHNLTKIVSKIDKSVGSDEVLWRMHDVQPMNNSRLLIYRNNCNSKSKDCSSIDLVENDFKKIQSSYKRISPDVFYSKVAGGVHLFDDGSFILSEIINDIPRVRHIDSAGKIIKDFQMKWVRDNRGVQRVQVLNLKYFLENNSGP